MVRRHLEEHGVDATVTRLDGAVETSVQLGVADVIADVVETGSTLRNAGLEVFGEPILESEAVLVTRAGAERARRLRGLPAPRSQGVLVARSYVMMDYDISRRARRAGGRADAGHREPDRGAAASRGLVRGPLDGAARPGAAGDGRAVGPRRPRHPVDGHPCLPALTSRALPHTFRPRGVRLAFYLARRAAALVTVVMWFAFPPEIRAKFTVFQLLTIFVLGRDVLRRRLRARPQPRRRARGRRHRGQRLQGAPAGVERGARGDHADGRPVGDARPRRRHHDPGRWASRAATARAP